MIDRRALLTALQSLLVRVEADLLQRSESAEMPEVGQRLRAEYERARGAQRTAQNYEDWRSDAITQAAAAWVLSCVFVRFLEDNQLIDPPKIAGPGRRLQQARDEWELYLSQAKQPNERDYLLTVFDELARLPGAKDVFGKHNPIRELSNWLSGDAAREMLAFFQKIDANSVESNKLVHDFTDPDWDTRFLGDLYQDLSEAAQEKYALLQTPEFVEEFILERTLEPAIDEFGLDGFRMIDPACGSGHFLLGSFRRLLDRWQKQNPGLTTRELVQRTLDSIHGVDVNPYAVAIARFRLLLAAMKACGFARLSHDWGLRFNLACGDSLLHGAGAQGSLGWHDLDHVYATEDQRELVRILRPGYYHAVVANPPYITAKDKAQNNAYRERYSTCHRQYSLGVPFMQRLFQLSQSGYLTDPRKAGFVGQITGNNFMKREFGKKLIEQYFAGRKGSPGLDITHVVDTSGAYIPGHGTPTVVLFGRHRAPVARTIRTVMGIRGEPSTPDDAAHGMVWTAILSQIDQPGSEGDFVSVADLPREAFHKHPWSIGGGGAVELKETIEEKAERRIEDLIDEIGASIVTREDDVYQVTEATAKRHGIPRGQIRPMVAGEHVRDWRIEGNSCGLWPYTPDTLEPTTSLFQHRFLWPYRTGLSERVAFGKTQLQHGKAWFEYSMLFRKRLRGEYRIAQAEIATHNHFVLDRGGRVFTHTAPVITLPSTATEDDYLALLGLLNSSLACFWLKQVCFPKGGDHVGQEGARVRRSLWDERYAFNATNLERFPLPDDRPLVFARHIDNLAQQLAANSPRAVIGRWQAQANSNPHCPHSLRQALDDAFAASTQVRGEMILMQEDLDWACYRLYDLIDEDVVLGIQPPDQQRSIAPGMRAFELLLAQELASGQTQTAWFDRHGITPRTELPTVGLNPKYHDLVARRMEIIRTNPQIRLVEQPDYKRRWYADLWGNQREEALRESLLDRLETFFDFDGRMNDDGQPTAKLDIALTTVASVADVARQDPHFMQVGEVYRDDQAFHVERLVAELVEAESVPLLPILRYKATGLRKRTEWERTWELQRTEDELARQRTESHRAVENERKRVADSFVAEKAELEKMRNDLSAEIRTVRDRFAQGFKIPEGTKPEIVAEMLGSHGVGFAGGAALRALASSRQTVSQKAFEFSRLVFERCRTDAGYQAAAERYNAIPPDPDITVPPKYASADFLKSYYWRLRGKLDVPKERWISFPHCEGPDGTLVIAWAGYDHLQLATAIGQYFQRVKDELGGHDDPRLVPLLACLLELLPWLKQWHNEPDAAFDGTKMGEYFEGFVNEEARQLGKTIPEIKAWEPPKKASGRKRK